MLAKLRRLSERTDAALVPLARLARAGISLFPLLLAPPVLAGSVYWFLKQPTPQLKLLDTNKLTVDQQILAAKPVGIAVGVVAALFLVLWLVLARLRGASFASVAARVGALLTPFLAVPFVVALMQPGIEKESPKLSLFFGLVIAAIIGVSAYRMRLRAKAAPLSAGDEEQGRSPKEIARIRWIERGKTAVAWACLLAIWGAYGWFFTDLAITHHRAMGSRTIDLGLYDNIFYNSLHGRWLACTFIKGETHLSAHFDPILVLLAPLYKFYPRAEMILGLQSVWIGSGVIPMYLLARHHLGSRVHGVLLAACYALHPALHGANMYEFHSLTLATVPMLWTLYALQAGRMKAYWLLLFVSLLVREDISLMMSMVGVTCLLLPGKGLRLTGLCTVLFCFVYFVVVKAVFMTSADVTNSGSGSYSFAYYYSEMIPGGKGVGGLLLTLVTNPTFALRHALEEPKIIYLVKIFGPLLLIPLATKSWRLTLLYGLAFTTLATRDAVFSTAFQYSTALLAFAFATVPIGVKQLSEGKLAQAYGLSPNRMRHALVFGALAASLAISYKFGGVIDNQAFKGGFSRIIRKPTPDQIEHYKWMEETKAKIPPKASLGVTNKIGPHVSNRKDVYFYGQKNVQYVFVDEKELKKDRLTKHKKSVEQGKLELLSRRGSYALFKVVNKPKPAEPPKPEPEPEDENVDDVLGDDPRE